MMDDEKRYMAQASFCLALAGPIMLVIFMNCSGERFFRYFRNSAVTSLMLIINIGFLYWLEVIALALGLYSREHVLAKAALVIAILHIVLSALILVAVRFAMG